MTAANQKTLARKLSAATRLIDEVIATIARRSANMDRPLDSVETWWRERLRVGTSTRRAAGWAREIPCQSLFADYLATIRGIGGRDRQQQTSFGIKLAQLLPGGIDRRKRNVQADSGRGRARAWCYLLPALGEARAHFERIVGQKVDWQSGSRRRQRRRRK